MIGHFAAQPLFSEETDALVVKANAERWSALFSRPRGLAPAVHSLVDTMAADVVAASEVLLPGSSDALAPKAKPLSRPPSEKT